MQDFAVQIGGIHPDDVEELLAAFTRAIRQAQAEGRRIFAEAREETRRLRSRLNDTVHTSTRTDAVFQVRILGAAEPVSREPRPRPAIQGVASPTADA
jgi:UDP-N-acetylmuramate-alanine ligase